MKSKSSSESMRCNGATFSPSLSSLSREVIGFSCGNSTNQLCTRLVWKRRASVMYRARTICEKDLLWYRVIRSRRCLDWMAGGILSTSLLCRHPDKAAHCTPEEKAAREEKMKEINSAYVRLQKGEDSDEDEDDDFFPTGPWNMPDELIALLCDFNPCSTQIP